MTITEFNEEQFLMAYPDGVENNYWTIARNLILNKGLTRNKLDNKKILEIGCGRGGVVNFLRNKGFDCYGVELAPIKISVNLEPYVKTDTDFKDLDTAFKDSIEVVMVLDVIEHLPDDSAFLESIKKNFRNLKYIFISVPARQDIWSNYDEYYGHYRRYNITDLRQTISKVGFDDIATQYFFHSLYMPAKIMKILGIRRGIQINSPKGFAIFINKLLGWLFYLEYIILPSRIFGSSILGVSKVK